MTALVFAIILGIAVFAIVVVGILFIMRARSSSDRMTVRRSFRRKDEAKHGPKAPRSQVSAEDSQRSIARRRTNFFGVLVVAVLGVLAIKNWSLQVLGNSQYAEQARSNMTATASIAARRGRVLDRKGRELITNRVSRTVVADSTVLSNRKVVHRLSLTLGIPKQAIRARLMDATSGAQSDRVVASDVSMRNISYISENPTVFPGVSVETRTQRLYPYGTLAAHLLGYAGTISEDELSNQPEGTVYESGDIVGKAGAEAAFETVLQGTKGSKTYRVNSDGVAMEMLGEVAPDPGNDIRLTIDLDTQAAAEKALLDGFAIAVGTGHPNGTRGAIVAMDVKTGGILAMASGPTYDPNSFVGGISQDLWAQLNSETSGYPMTNRAIAGLYPAASTYKAFTGLAGLTYGLENDKTKYDCQGTWTGFGDEYPKKCWDLNGHGELDIYHAIADSCDVYFYEVAREFYRRQDQYPEALQDYLRSWGFGSLTGIEIGGEMAGRVPDAKWKQEYFWETPEAAQWVPGDLANMVIGQGDVLITPLQLVTAYSGIASGRLLKPHVLYEVMNKDGQVVIPEKVKPSDFSPEVSPTNLKIMRDALRLAVTDGGVSAVFSGFPVNMAAKSGTGETGSEQRDDYAWFVAYGPFEDPKYCCACVIEQGGGGSAIAGPPVREVMSQLFGVGEDYAVSVAETGER